MSESLGEEERAEARKMFAEGKTLGEIAQVLGCSVYALSPWLYAEALELGDEREPA